MQTAFDAIHAVIQERITNPNALQYPDPWWEKEIDVLSADLDITIQFIRQECTDEELHWLGEIVDDLVAKTQNQDLIHAFRQRAEAIKDCVMREETLQDIEEAASYLQT